MRSILIHIIFLTFLSSCLGLRYLEPEESILLKDPEIKGIKSQYKDDANNLIKQKANNKIFGLPLAPQVYLYEFGLNRFDTSKYNRKIEKIKKKYDRKISKASKESKKEKFLDKKNQKIDKYREKLETGNWWMKNFEPLAIFDSSKHHQSKTEINNYLHNKGHFRSEVFVEFKEVSRRKTTVQFKVHMGPYYTIDSIFYTTYDDKIDSLLQNESDESHLEVDRGYDQDNIENERDRIYQLLTNNGYFNFSKQYISYRLDTTNMPDQGIIINQVISNPSGQDSHKVFRLDSIIVTTESSTATRENMDIVEYENTTYRFGKTEYNPKLLDWRLFLREGDLYSRKNTLETQKQLSYLDAFKFVNINYDSAGTDLIANIFTAPLKKFQTSSEVGFVVDASQQLPGPFANLTLKNRNTFGGLETIELTGNFALQGIQSIVSEDVSTGNYSLLQYGGRIALNLPQFLFPGNTSFKRRIASYNPRTQLSLGYSYEDRRNEYERAIANLTYSYSFRVGDNNSYKITPLSLSYTDVRKIENRFQEFLDQQDSLGNGALPAAFNSSFISSSSVEAYYNNNQYGNSDRSSSLLRLFGESGGVLTSIIGQEGINRLSNSDSLATFKWLKVGADYRNVDVKNSVLTHAFRINIGIAYPYGVSPSLPYEKRYFIGGSNSVRAWRIRRLGPGAYGIPETNNGETVDNDIRKIDYRLEQGGDMIIEASYEVRKPLIGFIDYAIFLDAGNIWILNTDVNLSDPDGDDGRFRFSSFLGEMALGAGLGLRFDLSFLVFRLDAAMQVLDPAQVKGNRFLLKNIDEMNPFKKETRDLFMNKSSLNIGIGFPF